MALEQELERLNTRYKDQVEDIKLKSKLQIIELKPQVELRQLEEAEAKEELDLLR